MATPGRTVELVKEGHLNLGERTNKQLTVLLDLLSSLNYVTEALGACRKWSTVYG